MMKKSVPYIVSALTALAVGGLSALLTKNNMGVYDTLNRPMLAPPMTVFPIVWSVLFVLMGISGAMVWEKREDNREIAVSGLRIYALQLAVNFFWSIIFFNLRAFLFAFIWLILLWVLIIIMMAEFKKISPSAAYLQIPYLIWVTFAGYLTLMIYLLN